METALPQQLQEYIYNELSNVAFYHALADIAPNEDDRKQLLEIANDEQSHADQIKKFYQSIMGYSYDPIVPPVELDGSYQDILRRLVLKESEDFRKYDQQYIDAKNLNLKKIFRKIRTDENVHTTKLIYLLSEKDT